MARLLVESKTWSRDSHGLYDYESRNVTVNQLQIASPCNIFRNDTNVAMGDSEQPPQNHALLDVSQASGEFSVTASLSQQLWQVVRQMKTAEAPGCVLREGDTVKLGRVELRVKELKGFEDADSAALTQESSEEELAVPIILHHRLRG